MTLIPKPTPAVLKLHDWKPGDTDAYPDGSERMCVAVDRRWSYWIPFRDIANGVGIEQLKESGVDVQAALYRIQWGK